MSNKGATVAQYAMTPQHIFATLSYAEEDANNQLYIYTVTDDYSLVQVFTPEEADDVYLYGFQYLFRTFSLN